LTKADLALDFRRRQPRGFISHAHADHMAPHAYALCTPQTAALYQFRFGRRTTLEMPYRKPLDWGGLRLTAWPAGHCLGSAMLLAEDGDRSLLYTGDFKLSSSLTAEPAELPSADTLIMECTFGRPRYRLPPQEEVAAELIDLVKRILQRGQTPVVHAYVTGKAQEITGRLTAAGIPVLQHPAVFAISEIYRRCGVDLGDCRAYPGQYVAGHAVVVPPRRARHFRLPKLQDVVSITATGWALDEQTRHRWGVDHALPLSDHADFDELLEAVARVQPRKVYCTHGPNQFVDHLCDAGFDAYPLGKPRQARLF